MGSPGAVGRRVGLGGAADDDARCTPLGEEAGGRDDGQAREVRDQGCGLAGAGDRAGDDGGDALGEGQGASNLVVAFHGEGGLVRGVIAGAVAFVGAVAHEPDVSQGSSPRRRAGSAQ